MKANDKPEVDKSIIINFLDIFMKHLNLLRKWAGEMTWWEKNLCCKLEDLSLDPQDSYQKPGMVLYLSPQKRGAETGSSWELTAQFSVAEMVSSRYRARNSASKNKVQGDRKRHQH